MTGEREVVDDPDKRLKAVFSKLAIVLYNTHIKAFHLTRAEQLEGYEEMNLNDLEHIGIPRDGLRIKNMIDATIKWYRAANFLWREGTGRGPGVPEIYCNWEERDTKQFQNYNNKGQGRLLAWIYMHDMESFFCLMLKVLIPRYRISWRMEKCAFLFNKVSC